MPPRSYFPLPWWRMQSRMWMPQHAAAVGVVASSFRWCWCRCRVCRIRVAVDRLDPSTDIYFLGEEEKKIIMAVINISFAETHNNL